MSDDKSDEPTIWDRFQQKWVRWSDMSEREKTRREMARDEEWAVTRMRAHNARKEYNPGNPDGW